MIDLNEWWKTLAFWKKMICISIGSGLLFLVATGFAGIFLFIRDILIYS